MPHFITKIIISGSEKITELLHKKLWAQVLYALVLGVGAGFVLGPESNLFRPELALTITNWLALPGNLFLQLVKMIIIPLIFSSVIIGIISAGSPEFLKKMGVRLIPYFIMTTVIATFIGFAAATIFQPGTYIDTELLTANTPVPDFEKAPTTIDFHALPEKIVSILPTNPIESMVNGDMLSIVIFSILFGTALLFAAKHHLTSIKQFLGALQDVSMTVVKWAMKIVPYAVFGLMTQVTAQIGIQALAGVGVYVITVITGLIVMWIVYLLIVGIAARTNIKRFMKAALPVQLLAFSTSSSAAVMPLTMKTAEEELDVDPSVSRFIIPLGATINMDGSALYQIVATIFLAQAFSIELPLASMLLIIVIAVGASIGAPGVPGVGIAILATILEAAGIPAIGLALILGVDRILDMSRTVINVTGDLTASVLFNKELKGEID